MRFEYREGDLIFQSLPRNKLVDAIEGMTQSEWSHCGVVMRENGAWVVYEALGDVHHTPLVSWIRRGRDNGRFAVYRIKDTTAFDIEKLRAALQSFWGKPYDYHYAPDDSAIYCSELIYKAFDRAAGIQIGEWQPLGSMHWKPFEAFLLTIEPVIPLGCPIVSPVSQTRSKRVGFVRESDLK
jgi:uncharacterized protein YycO